MKKLLVLPLLLLLVSASYAQTNITTATIQGNVLDPTGAVVEGATVEVRNVNTNFARTLTTDSGGRFAALLLPPGSYTVTVRKAGFATLEQQNLSITVGQTVNLNLPMQVAGVQDRIVVTDSPTVAVTTAAAASTIDQVVVSNTPILGRKFEDLLTLTPGVSIVQGPDGDEITFNGQRGIFNNISIDGGDHQNGFFGEQLGGQRAAVDITLEAVKEFQVIAAGGTAEYGRTAAGIVNVITKSGTNDLHGSIFHYQRLESLTSNTSDGKPLSGFHREQSGGTIGGPIVRDKSFYFLAFEFIGGNLQRPNLSEPLGSPCAVANPVITDPAHEAAINASPDCQRVALLDFMRASRNQEEGLPVRRPIHAYSLLGKWDWNLSQNHRAAVSYNFVTSRKVNETFDVATYGNSANGIEGTAVINNIRFNLLSTLTPTLLNEAHFGYSRESRPRQAIASNIPADTGIGFAPNFRFGAPFFLQPNVDELFWRTQLRNNVSVVRGSHTIKFGGEWMHSYNDQTFRGFFTGRYLFDSVTGFLRYASPQAAGGFGPTAAQCTDGSFVTLALGETCADYAGGPLLFFLQDGIPTGVSGVPPPGKSTITNENFSLFVQDKWQVHPHFTLTYGLRWEAQLFPDPVIPPSETAYGPLLSNPLFPSDGTLPNQWRMFQPRLGFAWDVAGTGKSVLRANWGIYNAQQNMLTQVGSITTNGAQQFGVFTNTELFRLGILTTPPQWPGITPGGGIPPAAGVRVFEKNYRNPRIYTTNVAYEQEVFPDWALYFDFNWSKGVFLTHFFDGNGRGFITADGTSVQPGTFPQLDFMFVTSSRAKSLYRGFTVGMRKRFSNRYHLEWNYVLAKDLDSDSNERDPFTDRRIDPFNPALDYTVADRDIRHKFNLVAYAELPYKIEFSPRIQARSAQPVTVGAPGFDAVARNTARKDNEFFSFDWRVQRPIRLGERYTIIPVLEMFNTFNNKNNVNPLTSPALFNFDGFLRQGVGDPRQLQFAARFTF